MKKKGQNIITIAFSEIQYSNYFESVPVSFQWISDSQNNKQQQQQKACKVLLDLKIIPFMEEFQIQEYSNHRKSKGQKENL